MLNNYYLVRIKGRNLKRFLKFLYRKKIYFINIVNQDDSLFCKLDQNNYKKLIEVKTSYDISLEKVYGYIHLKEIIRKNLIFLIFLTIGLFYLYFLSNIIFKIDIVHDNKEIQQLIKQELDKYGIKKYSFIKNYNYIKKIKERIIENNKNKIEWLEIERIGTRYIVRLERRIKEVIDKKESKRHLVAKKSGIIKKIDGSVGEITKKINDYVSKGDIIISGEIHKGEDIKDNVSASGNIYAEVWYKVKVSLPLYYYDEIITGHKINTLKIKYLKNEYNLFNKMFKNKKSINNPIFTDFYNMFSINYSNDKEVKIKDEINVIDSEVIALNLARDKLLNQLDKDEYIISQKKLKTIINNSTIRVEVFFKVYENISNYLYY